MLSRCFLVPLFLFLGKHCTSHSQPPRGGGQSAQRHQPVNAGPSGGGFERENVRTLVGWFLLYSLSDDAELSEVAEVVLVARVDF